MYERYERKRRERRDAALESRIATVPEGLELDGLARDLLGRRQLRFTRALAMRLKAETYERDSHGRAIIPPAIKFWGDRLDTRQAESFCRSKLGLPRLPAQRRSPYPTLAELMRSNLKRHRAEWRLHQRLQRAAPIRDDPWPGDDLWPEFTERPAPEVESPTDRAWTYEDERRFKAAAEREGRDDEAPDRHSSAGRTIEDLYYERIMAIPPPPTVDYAG